MKKVRPMIDKDLRDKIIQCDGGENSLNVSLRHYVVNHEGMILVCEQLKKEVARLHNEKVNLEKLSGALSKSNTSLADEINESAWRFNERERSLMYRWVGVGLIAGLSLGHLFL